MEKKTAIVLVIIGLLVLSAYNIGFSSFTRLWQGIPGGFTILSASVIDVIGKDTTNAKWVVLASFDGGADVISGAFTKEESETLTAGNYKTDYPLNIQAAGMTQSARYTLNGPRQQVFSFYISDIKIGSKDCFFNYCEITEPLECSDKTWEIDAWGYDTFGVSREKIGRICLKQDQIGQWTTIDNPSVGFKVSMSLSTYGTPETIEISDTAISTSGGTVSKTISKEAVSKPNGWVSATWSGNLATGIPLPNHNNYRAVLSSSQNVWKTVYATKVSGAGIGNSYQETYDNVLSTIKDNWQPSGFDQNYLPSSCTVYKNSGISEIVNCLVDVVDNKIIETNSVADNLVLRTEDKMVDNMGYDAAQQNFLINFNTRMFNPLIKMTINAKWIGIKILEGQPSVGSVWTVPTTFSAGEKVQVNAQVTNIGWGRDSFYIRFIPESCPELTQAFASIAVPIDAGGAETLSMSLTSIQNIDLKKTCRGEAIAQNSGLKVAFDILVDMKKTECNIEGEYRVVGNVVYKCMSRKWEYQQACEWGVDQSKTPPVCLQQPAGTEVWIVDAGQCIKIKKDDLESGTPFFLTENECKASLKPIEDWVWIRVGNECIEAYKPKLSATTKFWETKEGCMESDGVGGKTDFGKYVPWIIGGLGLAVFSYMIYMKRKKHG